MHGQCTTITMHRVSKALHTYCPYLLPGIGSRCIILSIRVTSYLRVILALCPALSPLLHLQARVSAVRVMCIEW